MLLSPSAGWRRPERTQFDSTWEVNTVYQVNLEGKVALVTGGSRGLGRAMVLGLARAGADVVIASRKLAGCEAVAEEVRALGRQALPVAAHAGQMESLDALLEATYQRFGRLDILINNAGTNPVTAGLAEHCSRRCSRSTPRVRGTSLRAQRRAWRRMAEARSSTCFR